MKDKYNYKLNGIEHEITLNHTLKIEQKPLNEKNLVANKYMMKYINDFFDFHSMEYTVVGNTLLGVYIFQGINIFNQRLEICTLENNFFKIKKLENEIINDDFQILFHDNYIKIQTLFLDKIKTVLYIYPLNSNHEDDLLSYNTYDDKIISHAFYDIFPIKKSKYEEFEVSVPNKIENILESYEFNLNYITFTKKAKDPKKIIDEVEKKNTIIGNIISIIKPFFYQE